MASLQIRIDDQLKEEAASIYESLGLDFSTAIRVFLKKCVSIKGIPFDMKVSDQQKANTLMDKFTNISSNLGNDKMTLEEINDIILQTRAEKAK